MIPLEETDKRDYELNYIVGFPYGTLTLGLTQLDILRIIKALQRVNNKSISEKLIKFIMHVDSKDGKKTLFERELPRREI